MQRDILLWTEVMMMTNQGTDAMNNTTINKRNILVTAGGTGGHISPGTALAAELRECGQIVNFLTLHKNKDNYDLINGSSAVYSYDAPSLSGGIRSAVTFIPRFTAALIKAASVIRSTETDTVAAMGGYPCLPALTAALLLRKRIVLFEQNVQPGKVTRWFRPFADHVFWTFPPALEGFSEDKKNHVTGNPIRPEIRKKLTEAAAQKKKKRKDFTVLVLGGSQGARQLNEMVLSIVKKEHRQNRFKIRWLLQCGSLHLEKLQAGFPESEYPELKLFAYHTAVQELYLQADVLISRAGAGIITEAAVFGLPSVFVPYPYAADNHQLANARYFESRGAAVVLDQKDSDPAALENVLKKLIENPEERESMSKAITELAVTDGAVRAARILTGENQ